MEEADTLAARGSGRAAVALLERALRQVDPAELVFIAEARYRLCGLYVSLHQWYLGEQVCQELLTSSYELGPSGRHDVLRHLARCLEALGRVTDADATRAQADALIEEIPDTAYRLFARQERLVRQRNFREALALQEELLTDHAARVSVPTLLCFTAFTAQHAGYPGTAEHYLSRALALPELTPALRWEMHRVGYHAAEAQGHWEAQLAHARQLHQLAATPRSKRYLATACLLNGLLEEVEELTEPDFGLLVTQARLGGDPARARTFIEAVAPGPRTDLLAAVVELEAGDGATALLYLTRSVSDSPLHVARRAWALALLGTLESAPEPSENPSTDELEACAQACWHNGDQERARELQRQLLMQPLAPVFRRYQEEVLERWSAPESAGAT